METGCWRRFSRWLKRTEVKQTLSYAFAYGLLGAYLASIGPAMMDLADNVGVSVETMSLLFTIRSFGYVVGTVVGGPLFDNPKLNGHHLLSGFVLLAGLATILVPLARHLVLLCAFISCQGVAMGLLDTGGNVMLLWLWSGTGEAVDPYMQGLHFAFGLGAFICPVIIGALAHREGGSLVAPFLVMGLCALPFPFIMSRFDMPRNKPSDHTSTPAPPPPHQQQQQQQQIELKPVAAQQQQSGGTSVSPSSVHVTVTSAAQSALELASIVEERQREQQVQQQREVEGQKNRKSKWYNYMEGYSRNGRIVILLVALYLCIYVGNEVSIAGYLYTYAVELGLASESHASIITSGFWGFFALGRLLAIPLATRWSAEKMLLCDMIGSIFSCVIPLLARDSVVALWIGVIICGMAMASSFPAAIVLGENYLGKFSGRVATVFVIGSSAGEMLLPLTFASIIAGVGWRSLFVTLLFSNMAATLTFLLLVYRGRRYRDTEGFIMRLQDETVASSSSSPLDTATTDAAVAVEV